LSCSLLPFAKERGVCDRCGMELTGRRTRWCSRTCHRLHVEQHRWTQARKAAVRRDRRCVSCGSAELLEVNHIVPREGRGYGWDCGHHLENLQVLCRLCHRLVTNAQAAARRAAKAEGAPLGEGRTPPTSQVA
jgi:5-methylcytosine-specific restriction endonuclease McrA